MTSGCGCGCEYELPLLISTAKFTPTSTPGSDAHGRLFYYRFVVSIYIWVCRRKTERKNVERKNIERKNIENDERKNVERKNVEEKISKEKISKGKNIENLH